MSEDSGETSSEVPSGDRTEKSRKALTVTAAAVVIAVIVLLVVVMSPQYSPLASVHDADGDGVADNGDAFPDDPDEWLDTDGDGYGDNIDQVEIADWTHCPNPYVVNARVESFSFVLINNGDTIGNVTVECHLTTQMYDYVVSCGVITVCASETTTCSVYVMMPDSDRTAIVSTDCCLIPCETE